jgi:hypothetical protein
LWQTHNLVSYWCCGVHFPDQIHCRRTHYRRSDTHNLVLCIYATLNPISSRKPDHGYYVCSLDLMKAFDSVNCEIMRRDTCDRILDEHRSGVRFLPMLRFSSTTERQSKSNTPCKWLDYIAIQSKRHHQWQRTSTLCRGITRL